MKNVYVIRHAKSDWSFGTSDFDRPLNERGRRDAPMMAERLLRRKVTIDAFVTSPALRALSTCRAFMQAYGRDEKEMILEPPLYHAPPSVIWEVISSMDDSYTSIALFSHNNGITDFANSLGILRIDNMPTCCVVGFASEAATWKDIRDAGRALLFLEYPKMA
jgi:phosphohistidine phosphatase